jgi:hypothetical protein
VERFRVIVFPGAERLAEMSRMGHCVPVGKIRELIDAWYPHLTVEQILNYVPNK